MITYSTSSRLTDIASAYNLLRSLNNYYPEFHFWFTNKVIPNILLDRDVLLIARDKGVVIGVAVGKRTATEVKLSCVRVHPSYQNRGIGIYLVEKMLRILNHDKPLCSVSQEMLHDFSRAFINLFKFDLTEVKKGLYRKGKLEYVFNGDLGAVSLL